jgi:hypothetical protein
MLVSKRDCGERMSGTLSYEEWRTDLDLFLDDKMSLDEFLEKWNGKDPVRSLRKEKPAEDDGLRKMIENARKAMGIRG